MKKLRTKFYGLSFTIRYVIAYLWTALAILSLLFGAICEYKYFWGIPVLMLIALVIEKDQLDIFIKGIMVMDMVFWMLDIFSRDMNIFTILAIEVLIIILGPIFFKEHAD